MAGILVIFLIFGGTLALENPEDFPEGACDKIASVMADRATMDSFKHILAGNKNLMYSLAAGMLRKDYEEMSEAQFYSEGCFYRNTTTLKDSIGTVFGFNGESLSFNVTGNPEGVYHDISPLDPEVLERTGKLVQRITLTDNKTFAFLHVCFPKIDAKGWNVISLKPQLDEEIITKVEKHAASLGFKEENFVFLRYDKCENPHIPERPVERN